MYIDLTPEQNAFRDELRAYYRELITPEVRTQLQEEEIIGPVRRRLVEQLGADGWIAMGWPEEYGGQGKSAIEQFIFFDESFRMGSPAPMLTINTVGPTIMAYGTAEQKDFFLPRIAAGQLHFCIGYSEPDAGTDLFSLTTKAVRDGDEYVINGQKTWTSQSQGADYIWLAARTNLDPEVKKQRGISIFAVPLDTPGISLEPLHLLSSHNITHTFFDDVRVPASAMIGDENAGFRLITSQLNRERISLVSSGMVQAVLDETAEYARGHVTETGERLIDQPWVQRNLALVAAKLEMLKLINWRVAWSVSRDALDVAESSGVKVYGTEFYLEAFRLLMQVRGLDSIVDNPAESHGASRLETLYRGMPILTFGGGTNEMQRDLITQFALGFPRADR